MSSQQKIRLIGGQAGLSRILLFFPTSAVFKDTVRNEGWVFSDFRNFLRNSYLSKNPLLGI